MNTPIARLLFVPLLMAAVSVCFTAIAQPADPGWPRVFKKDKDAGKVTVQPLPGQRARLTFSDYLKPGDSFALDVDLASNRPAEAKVTTYLESKDEPVSLDVRFGTLDNNATYASTVVLDAKSKNLTVNVQNSGYPRVTARPATDRLATPPPTAGRPRCNTTPNEL